jgi:YebC/PmpR family DNA-binding regulatory protein
MEGLIFEEITYEGYGPGGVAFLVDVLTDNRNRTNSEIRKIFERAGGKMGSAGNVGFLFERKGIFSIDASATDEDTLMGIALDAGADDLKRAGSSFEITCDPAAFNQVREALQKNNLTPSLAEISQVPKAPRDVDVEVGRKVMRLMEAIDDHDDVQNVYSDANITEAMVAEVE